MSKQLESINFLTCLREVIDLSSADGLTEDEKSSLSSFIMNEASDYEVMHFAMTGQFPDEKYNSVSEAILIEEIKNDLIGNSFELCESLGEDKFENLVESLVPLSDYGLSSSQSILEYLINTNLITDLISEGAKEKLAAIHAEKKRKRDASNANARVNRDRLHTAKGNPDANEFVSANADVEKRAKKDQDELAGYKKDRQLRSDTSSLEDNNINAKTYAKTQAAMGVHKAKEGAKNLGAKLKKAVTPLKQTKLGAGVEDDKVGVGTQLKTQAQLKAAKAKKAITDKINKYRNHKESPMGAGVEDDKVGVGTQIKTKGLMAAHTAKQQAIKAANSASEAAGKAAQFVKSNAKPIGGAVLAAALLYGGYKTFKRFFSKAAKACSNKSGAEKTACMVAFKKNAVKAQIADLRRSLSGCKNTSNPQKCQSTIQAKISKLQAKAA